MTKKIRDRNVPQQEALTYDGVAIARIDFGLTLPNRDNQNQRAAVRVQYMTYAVDGQGNRHYGATRESFLENNFNDNALLDQLIEESAGLIRAHKGRDLEVLP